jgi:hypothetical protein
MFTASPGEMVVDPTSSVLANPASLVSDLTRSPRALMDWGFVIIEDEMALKAALGMSDGEGPRTFRDILFTTSHSGSLGRVLNTKMYSFGGAGARPDRVFFGGDVLGAAAGRVFPCGWFLDEDTLRPMQAHRSPPSTFSLSSFHQRHMCARPDSL